mgnify:FL=1
MHALRLHLGANEGPGTQAAAVSLMRSRRVEALDLGSRVSPQFMVRQATVQRHRSGVPLFNNAPESTRDSLKSVAGTGEEVHTGHASGKRPWKWTRLPTRRWGNRVLRVTAEVR